MFLFSFPFIFSLILTLLKISGAFANFYSEISDSSQTILATVELLPNMEPNYAMNLTVSGKHWILPVLVNLNNNESFLVMNDSSTYPQTKRPYNYFDSPTLEWNSSDPIIKMMKNVNVTIGYNGNETIGLVDQALFKSSVFLQNYSTGSISGGISFYPKSSYLTYLQKQKIIQEKVFYFDHNYSATFVSTFNFTIGSLPENRANLHWVNLKNNIWGIPGVYVTINREYVDSCQGVIYFNDTLPIQVSSHALEGLKQEIQQFSDKNGTTPLYKCDKEVLEKYPVLSIYAEDIALNITAKSYLDLRFPSLINETLWCPLLIQSTGNLNSYCAVVGYSFFGFQFLAFSQEKQAIGFDPNEVTELTMIDNKFDIIPGVFGLIMSLIFIGIGMNYFEKQTKLIEEETANYPIRKRINSIPDSDELSSSL